MTNRTATAKAHVSGIFETSMLLHSTTSEAASKPLAGPVARRLAEQLAQKIARTGPRKTSASGPALPLHQILCHQSVREVPLTHPLPDLDTPISRPKWRSTHVPDHALAYFQVVGLEFSAGTYPPAKTSKDEGLHPPAQTS